MSCKLPIGVATTYNAGTTSFEFSCPAGRSHPLAVLWLAGVLYGGVSACATEGAASTQPGGHLISHCCCRPNGRRSRAPRKPCGPAFSMHRARRPIQVLPIRVYAVTDDARNVIDAYRKATAADAQVVVGPLTRSGVSALSSAGDILTVKTLALNVPERSTVPCELLHSQLAARSRSTSGRAACAERRAAQSPYGDRADTALTAHPRSVQSRNSRRAAGTTSRNTPTRPTANRSIT